MFKEMARYMPDEEVKRCMAILVENSIVLNIERDIIQNEIEILPGKQIFYIPVSPCGYRSGCFSR